MKKRYHAVLFNCISRPIVETVLTNMNQNGENIAGDYADSLC